jgi:predicted RNase H-like HicB family nuclease
MALKAEEEIIVYPTVVYDDVSPEAKTYCLVLKDLALVTTGKTIEEAYADMDRYLEGYYECAKAIDEEITKPTSFEIVKKSKTKNIVLLNSIKGEK